MSSLHSYISNYRNSFVTSRKYNVGNVIITVMIIATRSRGPANGFDGEEMKFSTFFPPSQAMRTRQKIRRSLNTFC